MNNRIKTLLCTILTALLAGMSSDMGWQGVAMSFGFITGLLCILLFGLCIPKEHLR